MPFGTQYLIIVFRTVFRYLAAMARTARIAAPGMAHHVTQRGNRFEAQWRGGAFEAYLDGATFEAVPGLRRQRNQGFSR